MISWIFRNWKKRQQPKRTSRKKKYLPKKSRQSGRVSWSRIFMSSCWVTFFLVLMCIAMMSVWQLYRFASSNYFLVKGISFQGMHLLDESDLLQCSQIQYNSNIFRLDLAKVHDNLIRHPYIKEARMTRTLPSDVAVTIVEHTPFILLNYQDQYSMLSRDGIVMERFKEDDRDRWDLPVIYGLQDFNVDLGQACQGLYIDHCLRVLKEMLKSDLAKVVDITSVNPIGDNHLTFRTREGVDLIFSSDHIRQGMELLGYYLSAETQSLSTLQYIDLRFDDIVVKKR